MSDWRPSRSPRERDKVECSYLEMTQVPRSPELLSRQVSVLDDAYFFVVAKKSTKADATEYREQLKTRSDVAVDATWSSPKRALLLPTRKAEDGGTLLGIDCGDYICVAKPQPEGLHYGSSGSPLPRDALIKSPCSPQPTTDDECWAVRTADNYSFDADECDGRSENRCVATDATALAEPPTTANAIAYDQPADEQECGTALHLPVMLEAMEDAGFPEAETTTPVSSPPSPVGQPMQCSDDGTDESFLPASDESAPIKTQPLYTAAQSFFSWKFLGKGQFGATYAVKAHSGCPSEEVLKLIASEKYRTEEFELPHKYPHEHVARMFRREQLGTYVGLFQEYVEGKDLEGLWSDNRQRGRTLSDSDLDVLGRQMLGALQHLDDHRIIHRDIKPSNIIRGYSTYRGVSYKLIDFGLSEQLMDGEKVRCVKGFRGSFAYSAPECCRPCPPKKTCQYGYNTKADMWSLAVTLMQMCSFQVPWHHYIRDCEALRHKLLTQPQLMQGYAQDETLVHCSSGWRQALVRMLSPVAAARPYVGELLDSMDQEHREQLPNFMLLTENVADCTPVDADAANESCEFKSSRLSLPDLEQLQE